jgi:hypothetical protein
MAWRKSRARLNLALACLVAFLISVTYLRPGLKHEMRAPPLVADAGKLEQVRITLTGKPPIDLKRDGGVWRMQAPLEFPADTALMQGFLDSLDAPVQAVANPGKDLATYGLDKPLVRLWLDGEEYDFGSVQPVTKERYLLHAGQLLLVDDYVFYRITHDSWWWLDKRVLPEGGRITAMQLPHVTLTQDAKGAWQLEPADKSVTQAMLQRFVTGWQDAYAMGMAPIGKGKPLGDLSFSLAGVKEPLRFQILDEPDYLVLARPDLGLEYQLDPNEMETLLDPSSTAEAK